MPHLTDLETLPIARSPRSPLRYVGQGLSLLLLAALGWVIFLFLTNRAMRWDTISTYLFAPIILDGIRITLWLTAGSAVIGVVGGTALALARLHGGPLLRALAGGYINLFRAVPLLVQILICYNIGSFFPRLGIFVPFTELGISWPTNAVLTPLIASFLAFGLHQSAYLAEIIRAGIETVPQGQIEAARALGMTAPKVFRRVTLPIALRAIIPPFGNDLINLLKATSLVSVVGVGDLMTRAEGIYAVNYQIIPLLLVASIWYLVLTSGLSLVQSWIEQRVARHSRVEPAAPGVFAKLLRSQPREAEA